MESKYDFLGNEIKAGNYVIVGLSRGFVIKKVVKLTEKMIVVSTLRTNSPAYIYSKDCIVVDDKVITIKRLKNEM